MSSIECPSCGAELIHDGIFRRRTEFGDWKVIGDIYRCPVGLEEGECDSSCFHVAGSWYAYKERSTVLNEGYPC